MPVKRLPPHPDLAHLKYQARDLLSQHAGRRPDAAQRIREFHPRFRNATDEEIFTAPISLSAAQLAIAREYGYQSWSKLKNRVQSGRSALELSLPHHERIEDSLFRQAVDLIDAGDQTGLRTLLAVHPDLVRRRMQFEGGNYFRSPTLIEFIAENPVRRGKLPAGIVSITEILLAAGPEASAVHETLVLVATGCVPRQCRVQIPLIDLLCARGADPAPALDAAACHGEFEAAQALLARGAPLTLAVAAALGRAEEFEQLLPRAGAESRHRALALASQFGRCAMVRALLDHGENPGRYNPLGAHSHSTPLHQAALAGHEDVVRLLLERGADAGRKDLLWQGTAADWARHAGRIELETLLRRFLPS